MPRALVDDALIESRLALAGAVARALASSSPVVAGVVVGSTALRRCSPRADLDLVVVTPAPSEDAYSTEVVDGVRVEVERLSPDDALAATSGSGWVWELRTASRLGTGVPVYDPEGFGAGLADRAAAMTPDPERFEDTLRAVYHALIELGGPESERDPGRRLDALRGCLDNLALLALLERPRRFQKPKWVLADLLHAGEDDLVSALVVAYGASAGDSLDGCREVIERAYEIAGVPGHDELLAMGHAPDWAEASYVSRTLDDALDLAASGRLVEARYTALFSARLAAGVLGGDSDEASVVDVFAAHDLADRYLGLFPVVDEGPLRDAAVAAAEDRRRTVEGVPAA